MIKFINPFSNEELQMTDGGLYHSEKIVFKKINGAYRVLESDENYTENFGYQWNKFVKTQIDDQQNNISKIRFFAETNWDKEDLAGKNVLEVGSGAGRFSEVILNHTKANLYSVDYSNAVEANYKNNGHHGDRLRLFQASIYDMPFAPGQFDKVVCVGVLQHTPDVERSVKSLISMVKPGGELVVDFYPVRGWWTKLHAKYIFRPYTKRLSHEKLYKKIDSNIDWLIKTYRFFSKAGVGKITNRFLPICDIDGTLPKNLTKEQLREWCVLDTFDMFGPQYDQPQRLSTVVNWFGKYGMKKIHGRYVTYENCYAPVVSGIKD